MPEPPQKIALTVLSERAALNQTRNFSGTPEAPHEIALAVREA